MKMALMMAFGLAIATTSAEAAPSHAKWMGEASCAAWPLQESYNDVGKALLLNWVLGWLSRSGKDGSDLLSKVDQPTVSGWVDHYCAAHPTDTLISAVVTLETQLTDRAMYSRL